MARKTRTATFIKDPLWYKDAVIYQVHVKSFFDSNNDGIGDFPGLIAKLDYIKDLGVNTIWSGAGIPDINCRCGRSYR
jgi:maltose alpha-D-glucosyltransferase / alpha-amylase